jgi:hypothetical protein
LRMMGISRITPAPTGWSPLAGHGQESPVQKRVPARRAGAHDGAASARMADTATPGILPPAFARPLLSNQLPFVRLLRPTGRSGSFRDLSRPEARADQSSLRHASAASPLRQSPLRPHAAAWVSARCPPCDAAIIARNAIQRLYIEACAAGGGQPNLEEPNHSRTRCPPSRLKNGYRVMRRTNTFEGFASKGNVGGSSRVSRNWRSVSRDVEVGDDRAVSAAVGVFRQSLARDRLSCTRGHAISRLRSFEGVAYSSAFTHALTISS